MLPVNDDKFLISSAIDFVNGEQLNSDESQKLFKKKLIFRVIYVCNKVLE